jgi:hypothetical protein
MIFSLGLSISYAETTTGSGITGSSGTYTDISGHWAEAIIKEAASLGIVGGYPDGTYLPDNLIKREEFFKLLTNILTEKPDTTNTKIQFMDVVDFEWYVPTIKTAVAAGITSGYGDGTFGIGMMISRQEAAKVAGSVIPTTGTEDEKGAESALDKGQIADWAYKYVDLMFKKGYMKGDTEGNFRPTMALTRAEAAAILLNVKKNEPIIAANADELATTDCMAVHKGQEGFFTKGSGSKSDPYEITTEEQLDHMRMHATEGAFYVLKKNIAITKDYSTKPPAGASGEPNWTEGNFSPIGSKEVPFKGSLDGNGYIISGLNIIGTAGSGSKKTQASYAGLFGYLAPGSSIIEVIIDASTISGNQYTGAIAGYNEGTVKSCQLDKKGVVSGKTYTGGLVGYSTQPLISLRNRGEVTGTAAMTGGIVGSISAAGTALQYCQNEGTVIGNEHTGGIVGKFLSAADASAMIQECYNKGTVKAGPYNAGGIAGTASGGNMGVTIEGCGNSGTVTGSGINGGIAGSLETSKATVKKSKNTGDVMGNGAGGIVGFNQGEVSYSYNSGEVKASNDAGGIAAYQQNREGKITKCYNEGEVSTRNNAGGIVGQNGSQIDNCYNSGKVRGTNSAGGIVGKNTSVVMNVYCAGIVSGDNGVGALIGRNAGSISNSYWLESVGTAEIGMSDEGGRQVLVIKVSREELSGQVKIKTSSGYQMLIDVMNANNATNADVLNKTKPAPVWEYLYTVENPASETETNTVSDGGGIVPPIEFDATDMKGNTIKSEDLTTKYLYPSIIN